MTKAMALLIAAASLSPVPALADSNWMGSINFTNGSSASSTWTARLKDGEGTMKVGGGAAKFHVQKSNSFFIVSQKGGGVVGTGMVYKGHVAGTFKVGNAAGEFQGDRAGKGGGKGKK